MVKSRKKLPLTEVSHKFFKVFLPDQSSQQMKFPSAFLNYFNAILPCKSTIISLAKKSWQVDLEKVCDSLYFRKGWEQFVQDNSLECGDFLVFCYGGNARFHIKIYGRNGCEKEVTYPTGESCRVSSFPQEIQTVETRNSELQASKGVEEDDRSALKEASRFKSANPFFTILMKPSYVNYGSAHIPTSFTERSVGKDIRRVGLLYSNKLWPVKVLRCTKTIRKFSSGWGEFSRDNALKEGDVCVFELIERNDYVLKVSIFRCPD